MVTSQHACTRNVCKFCIAAAACGTTRKLRKDENESEWKRVSAKTSALCYQIYKTLKCFKWIKKFTKNRVKPLPWNKKFRLCDVVGIWIYVGPNGRFVFFFFYGWGMLLLAQYSCSIKKLVDFSQPSPVLKKIKAPLPGKGALV